MLADVPKMGESPSSAKHGKKHTRVSVSHLTPLALLASVYEKPSTCPEVRPKRPCRLGPILFPSPSPRVWHCAQRVLKRLAPFFESPVSCRWLADILVGPVGIEGFSGLSAHAIDKAREAIRNLVFEARDRLGREEGRYQVAGGWMEC